MTDETLTRLSGWDRAGMAAVWCRDKLASWLATTWLYLILWTVVAMTFGVLLYIDGKFSRGLAEGVEAINPLSFQMMGWAYRLFAAAFLMAAARCAYKGIKGKWTFRGLGAFASVIVCLHAFGFGFEALSDRRDQAVAVREVIETKAAGKEDLIAALETRKATIDTDTDKATKTLDAEIYNLDHDGKLNEDLTTRMRDRRTQLQDKATADKEALDKEILALMREASDGKVEGVQANVEARPWAPLFVGIAQLATWSKEPTDWAIYLCAIGFVIFWVLLGESLVIFLPERIYVMHLKDAEGRPHEEYSADLPAGHARWEGPEEELEAMLKARDVHANIKAGAKKGARTRRVNNKIEMGDEYAREKIADWMKAHNEGVPTFTIANGSGMTVAQMKASYWAHMTPEEQAALFMPPEGPFEDEQPTDEPEAPEQPEEPVAVADSPQDEETLISEPETSIDDPESELTIPDEPKTYGVSLYEPPANETDEDEEAAA